ncbi:hypothetical protein [Deinococcus humi]
MRNMLVHEGEEPAENLQQLL